MRTHFIDGSPAAVLDQRELRTVLGNFCTGVTIVTAMTAQGPVGFTCQSFSSLSLDPPKVILCPSRTSKSWPLIRAAGNFCVNVLAQDQAGLSTHFARSGGNKFEGVPWRDTPAGAPLLDGAAAWFDVLLHAEHDGGDHTVVIGDLLGMGAQAGAAPLLFHRGMYASIA